MSLAATQCPFSLSLGPSADRFDHFLDELPQRGRRMAIAHVPIADRKAGRVMLNGLGQPLPETRRQAVDALASLTGADPSSFHAILELREGKRKEKDMDVEATLHTYLEFVEIVTNEVDRRLEAH